jgi:copper transport protein
MSALGAAPLRLRGKLTRTLVAAGVSAIAILSSAGVASAHVTFDGSDPPDGAALATAPGTVALDFSQNVDVALTQVALTDGAGHHLTLPPPTVDDRRPTRLVVHLPALPPEAYRLSFTTRDSVDLHVTSTSVVFGIGTVPNLKSARPVSRGPDGSEVALRWLARTGLAVLLGALAVLLLVLPRAFTSTRLLCRLQRRLLGLALLGLAAAAAGDTALLGLQATQIGSLGPTFSQLVSQSEFGRRWLIGVQLGVGLTLVLLWLRRQASQGRPVLIVGSTVKDRAAAGVKVAAVLACLLAMGQAVTVGISGHTGGASTPTAAGVALRAAHLLSVGAWVGGLVAVAVVLSMLRRLPVSLAGPVSEGRPALLRRFSTVAAAGLGAVVVTGLLLSGTQVATVTALLTTWYGVILLVKVGVLTAVALVGLRHARLVRARAANPSLDRRVRRSIPLEAAGGLVVVLLGAALGATAPARGPQFNPNRPPTSPAAMSTSAADLLIRVSLQPNRPGRNLLTVDVLNTRRPAPAPIGNVIVKIRSATGSGGQTVVTTSRTSDSHWDGGAVNLAPGSLAVDVSVLRSGLLSSDVALAWTVNGTDVWRQPTVLSSAPLAPLATRAAVVVALLALAFLLLSRLTQRRRRSPGSRPRPGSTAPVPVADSEPRPVGFDGSDHEVAVLVGGGVREFEDV